MPAAHAIADLVPDDELAAPSTSFPRRSGQAVADAVADAVASCVR